MFLDSIEKYKPGMVTDDSMETLRKGRYDLYLIMYNYYKEKSK